MLVISGNHTIGEAEQLYSILTDISTMLEQLYMIDTHLSSTAAINLFIALKDNNKLKELYIDNTDITNDVSIAICIALEINSCLVELHMSGMPLTDEVIIEMMNGLQVSNNTLAVLWFPEYPKNIKKTISPLQQVTNKERESRGC